MTNSLKNSTILVTGGAGFIGSCITEKLLLSGSKVIVLDNFSSGKKENINFKDKNLEIVKADILNSRLLEKITKGTDYILHQAALTSVPQSVKSPMSYQKVNVEGTLKILKAAVKNKVKRVVIASSSSVYGNAKKYPQKETYEPKPISPYAASKLSAEIYCKMFTKCYGLETVCLRYFNVFGPKQSLDNEYAMAIPKFITSLLESKPTPIYGNGKQSRDFIYVDNIVKANLLAITNNKVSGETFNVGSGSPVTILGLSQLLQKILNKPIKPIFLKPRSGDAKKTEADISKIKKATGFHPKPELEEGLKKTIKYYLNQKKA